MRSLVAFAAIALVSSAVYVYNDLKDVEQDRRHPIKRNRPIAAGAISVGTAWALFASCLTVGIGLAATLNIASLAVIFAYLLIQLSYNLGAKNVPVTDVFLIAMGFVVRAVLGATAIDVKISGWLLLCTAALALMLGFGKRRSEFVTQGEDRAMSRRTLAHYSRPALDSLVTASAVGAAMCYGIYSLESPTAQAHPGLVLTPLWVVYGIYRYLFVNMSVDAGGEPENLLFGDPHIRITVILFVLNVALAMGGMTVPVVDMSSFHPVGN